MFTFSSTLTKISVLAFSALTTWSTADTIAGGFQVDAQTSVAITLPAVTIVGRRADLMQDKVHVASTSKSAESSANL